MTEKINIMGRECYTCEHLKNGDRPDPCHECAVFGAVNRPNWSPAFYCPGDCAEATKLRADLAAVVRERDEARESVKVGLPLLHEAVEAKEKAKAERDEALRSRDRFNAALGSLGLDFAAVRARAAKAEADVERLKRGIERMQDHGHSLCCTGRPENREDSTYGVDDWSKCDCQIAVAQRLLAGHERVGGEGKGEDGR